MNIEQVEVRRKAFGETRITSRPARELDAGDMIGYWKFFPVEEPWGIVPVWGFAEVVQSRCDAVPVGERVWGFLPMASHVVLQSAQVTGGTFSDGAAHRTALPAIYNSYQRTRNDPPELAALATWRADGRLRFHEHVLQGFDAFPEAFDMLFSGANHGKLLIDFEEQG